MCALTACSIAGIPSERRHLGSAPLLMAAEEHGGGKQLARIRTWPRLSVMGALQSLQVQRDRGRRASQLALFLQIGTCEGVVDRVAPRSQAVCVSAGVQNGLAAAWLVLETVFFATLRAVTRIRFGGKLMTLRVVYDAVAVSMMN